MPSAHGGVENSGTCDNKYDRALEIPNAADAVAFLRLLIAADTFPQGGLFDGFYCMSATQRYEHIWLRVLQVDDATSIPPLDVALAWLIHRQFPVSYANTCLRRCGKRYHPDHDQAFTFSAAGGNAWQAAAGDEAAWPPPAPGSEYDVRDASGWNPTLSSQLGEFMSLFSWQLRSWLRPHFLDANFLEAARQRYSRFLRLLAANPNLPAVPTADIALFWHTHLGLSGHYAQVCEALSGTGSGTNGSSRGHALWRPMYVELEAEELRQAYGETATRYQELYGEPYDGPYTAWVPHGSLHPLAQVGLSPLLFALRAYEDGPASLASGPLTSSLLTGRRRSTGAYTSTTRSPFMLSSRTNGPIRPSGKRLMGNVSGKMGGGISTNNLMRGQSELEADVDSAYAGGHALYAVWRAARTAEAFWDAKTCGGLCLGGSWSVRSGTIEETAKALVSLADPGSVPDSHLHEFLMSVRSRPGLLRLTQQRMMKQQKDKPRAVQQQQREEQREQQKQEQEGQQKEAEMQRQADEQVQGQTQEQGQGQEPGPVAIGEGVEAAEQTKDGDDGVSQTQVQAPPPAGTPAAPPAAPLPKPAFPFRVNPLQLGGQLGSPDAVPGETLLSPFGTHMVDDSDMRTTMLATSALRSRPFHAHAAVAKLRVNVDSAAKTPRTGPFPMFNGIGFDLEDAEIFLDDPALHGLTALLRAQDAASATKVATASGGSGSGGSTSGGDDAGQSGSSNSNVEHINSGNGDSVAANGGGGADADDDLDVAPLWSILADTMYAKRLRTLYEHLWRLRAIQAQQSSGPFRRSRGGEQGRELAISRLGLFI